MELAVDVMDMVFNDRGEVWPVNVPNRGAISDLPDDLVVEVPGYADGAGVTPMAQNPLPGHLSGLCAFIQTPTEPAASEELTEGLGAKRLLSVPGFERGRSGKVWLSLPQKEEHVLLPCFDGRGLVAGIEALRYDAGRGELVDPDRTVPLSGASAHLYVFAPYSAEEIEGFGEGPLGTILAAQEDVVLGAMGHFRRYAADPGSDGNAERAGTVLPELEGVDFGGRQVAYVPKVGAGEENARAREARNACRYLVERQNGVPQLVFPSTSGEQDAGDAEPESGERRDQSAGPTSLAEWIFALPERERQGSLRELFPESPNQIDPRHYRQAGDTSGRIRKGRPGGERRRTTPPEMPALSALAMVLLTATAATGLDLLLGSLEAFGQHVGAATAATRSSREGWSAGSESSPGARKDRLRS